MAEAILGGGEAVRKSSNLDFNTAGLHPGLLVTPALTPEAQVKILSVVDATGTATLGDIVDALPHHAVPVQAVLDLVAAGLLTLDTSAAFDQNLTIRRSEALIAPDAGADSTAAAEDVLPDSLAPLTGLLVPELHVFAPGQRQDLQRATALDRRGVYFALFHSDGPRPEVYAGYGTRVGQRTGVDNHLFASGEAPDRVVLITESNNGLDELTGRCAERALWLMLSLSGQFAMRGSVPTAVPVDPDTYERVRWFVLGAMLLVRQAGLACTGLTGRELFAGFECDPDLRVGPDQPAGDLLRLVRPSTDARAIAGEAGWTLLAGSRVRGTPVPSSAGTATGLRTELRFAGILSPVADDQLQVNTNLTFKNYRAAGYFAAGAKNHPNRRDWKACRARRAAPLLDQDELESINRI